MSEPEVIKPCPFCGGEAGILAIKGIFQIVGCKGKSMLCPNPTLVVYPDKNGYYDYKYWNTRNSTETQAPPEKTASF